MTVEELVLKLKELPQAYRVLCEDLESYLGDFDIESIEVDSSLKHIVFKAS